MFHFRHQCSRCHWPGDGDGMGPNVGSLFCLGIFGVSFELEKVEEVGLTVVFGVGICDCDDVGLPVGPIVVGTLVRPTFGGEVYLAVGIGVGYRDGNGVGITVGTRFFGP